MKICIVTHEYPPYISSGPGRTATHVVEYLVSRGHDVTVITLLMMGGSKYEKKGNLEIYRLNIFKSKFIEKFLPMDIRLLLSWKLRSFFKKTDLSNFDILHVMDKFDSFFLNSRIKIPKIVSVNDTYALESSWNIFKFPYISTDILLRYTHYQLVKILDKYFLKKANLIIANSYHTAKIISKTCNISKSKIKVIHKGIKIKDFNLKIPDSKYLNHAVLYVGKNMERKGVWYLVNAMPYVVNKFPDAKFIFIGKSNLFFKAKVKKFILSKCLRKNVQFYDYIHPDKISEIYRKANVFCIPSVMEALGQVQLEAMAAQTPVIGSDVGGIPETITPKTGILVKPKSSKEIAEAIVYLFSNPKIARRMGKTGLRHVQNNFNANLMAKSYLQIYESFKLP
ncbi:glycosyltransferase family 4 protein [Candidatus Woesearchaeota archaeon]|nr:glycosyltransferase family 4 protein [Candidatus Woesearchaeota archaeon]